MSERCVPWRSKPPQVRKKSENKLVCLNPAKEQTASQTCAVVFINVIYDIRRLSRATMNTHIAESVSLTPSGPPQKRPTPFRLVCAVAAGDAQEVCDLLQLLQDTQLFLVQRPGPTSFVVREEGSEVKRKVAIGSRLTCSW